MQKHMGLSLEAMVRRWGRIANEEMQKECIATG